MPATMKGTPSPTGKAAKVDTGFDMASGNEKVVDAAGNLVRSNFGGDRQHKSVYKGPKAKKDSRYATGPILSDEAAGGGWGVHGSAATVGMDEVKDKRTSFEKAFDDKQAAWMDNLDRSDDALYHRSFDDGSLHLKDSRYRDGKPVDNHGKEIGGMGAAAVTKYRRHDLQSATSVGETA